MALQRGDHGRLYRRSEEEFSVYRCPYLMARLMSDIGMDGCGGGGRRTVELCERQEHFTPEKHDVGIRNGLDYSLSTFQANLETLNCCVNSVMGCLISSRELNYIIAPRIL